jgi:aminoglycoside/choline kinase family phosphotransferase
VSDNLAALHAWVGEQLSKDCTALALSLIAGDASPRQYFRATWYSTANIEPCTAIAVLAPATEKTAEFLLVQRHLQEHNIRVPKVLAQSVELGFMLLEDLGDRLLLPALSEQTVAHYYETAQAMLLTLAHPDVAQITIDAYDRALLRRELDLFPDWYIRQLLKLPIDDSLAAT